jgi:hypothetical protein
MDIFHQISEIKTKQYLYNDIQNKTIDNIKSNLICYDLSREEIKKLKTQKNLLLTQLNEYNILIDLEITNIIVLYLFNLESFKSNGLLPLYMYDDIKKLYNILAESGRFNARYIKLPKSWILLGSFAGILEDLVVVMRTASQLKISSNHLITLNNLISGFSKFITDDTNLRFVFLSNLLQKPIDIVENVLNNAISSQGIAKRISSYTDSDGTIYYYAIQGLIGGVLFDSRVVKTLTLDKPFPPYAVHFTKKNIALSIWQKNPTTSTKKRSNGLEIIIGAINKFDRPIHALTNIEFDGSNYHIVSTDKDIKDRMTHGIKDTIVRPKYEAGLVINVTKLISIMPYGYVQINEIGTLLVHDDIIHDCLLDCIINDTDIEKFWCN